MIKLRVKEILKERGITQKELADKLSMTEVGLSKSINDGGNPPLKKLEDIASILNVDFIELFVPKKDGTSGYIEHRGTIYKINSIEDIKRMLEEIEK